MNIMQRLGGRWEKPAALVAAAIGLLLIVNGWVGVSGEGLVTAQLPYLVSGAVGGLFALGVAATLWLSSDMRDEYVKLDEIHAELRDQGAAASSAALNSPQSLDALAVDGRAHAKRTVRSSHAATP